MELPRHSTVTVSTMIVAVFFFIANCLICLTNEKNTKGRPHTAVAVSDFFRWKEIPKHILALLFFSVAHLTIITMEIATRQSGASPILRNSEGILHLYQNTTRHPFFIAWIFIYFFSLPIRFDEWRLGKYPLTLWHFGTNGGGVKMPKCQKCQGVNIESDEKKQ